MPVRQCLVIALVVLSAAVGAQSAFRHAVVPGWPILPVGRTAIGSMHGDVAASSADEVYRVADAPPSLVRMRANR